jgi:hypothetical protein
MAQRIVLIDDMDGSEATETVRYSIDKQDYELDLSEKNADELRKALQPYIAKSRQVDHTPPLAMVGGRSSRRRSGGGSKREDLPEIRACANSNGLKVSERGRIKAEIIEQYDREHS